MYTDYLVAAFTRGKRMFNEMDQLDSDQVPQDLHHIPGAPILPDNPLPGLAMGPDNEEQVLMENLDLQSEEKTIPFPGTLQKNVEPASEQDWKRKKAEMEAAMEEQQRKRQEEEGSTGTQPEPSMDRKESGCNKTFQTDLPWNFRSSMLPSNSFRELTERFSKLNIKGNPSAVEEFFNEEPFTFTGILTFFHNRHLLPASTRTKVFNMLQTSRDKLRPIEEVEEYVGLIMTVALAQMEHDAKQRHQAEIDQYALLTRQIQSSLNTAIATVGEATKGITADRSVIQDIHKELKGIKLNTVVYKSGPSLVEREEPPRASRKLNRMYHFKGTQVCIGVPGTDRAIGISSHEPSEEVKAKMHQVRAFLNEEESKILNEANAGISHTLDTIMEQLEFTK